MSTHALAIIVTQPTVPNEEISSSLKISRMKKGASTDILKIDPVVKRFSGPKKVVMPVEKVKISQLTLKALASQKLSVERSQSLDFKFLTTVLGGNSPEFNGFNSKVSRDNGDLVQPATKCVYLPLLNDTLGPRYNMYRNV